MDLPARSLVFLIGFVGLSIPQLGTAAVVFKPGENAKLVPPGILAPGEEEMNGNAQELFQKGQAAERAGNLGSAIRAYRALVRRYPRDALAAGALFKMAELQEQSHQYLKAAVTYRALVERYPSSDRFNEAIEAQFRIGEMYLAGKKQRLLGIPIGSALERAVEIFASVVRTAPYGKYTARAQFDIGLVREKQGAKDAALEAYQAVADKFPNEPVAADAQYQVGYIWFTAARQGARDIAATHNAKTAFEDFLFRHPNSEKAAQARANLQLLEHKQTNSSYEVAKFYDKQKKYRAAAIYYNEVIRQQPGSAESSQAQKRIDQLRAKYGDAALQPRAGDIGAEQKKTSERDSGVAKNASGEPPGASSVKSNAPLPPSDADTALPPPASLLPDTTTAPATLDTDSTTTSSPSRGASPAPASPDASASPSP
ncbi:MAG TPA: outer membrane protein assembly factor BamD [Chthoniobacterales bacterium]|nr:outer membrane protein assembly factor BamD [Chthoniobacterales bacterium]